MGSSLGVKIWAAVGERDETRHECSPLSSLHRFKEDSNIFKCLSCHFCFLMISGILETGLGAETQTGEGQREGGREPCDPVFLGLKDIES